jgi:hypothetical protein
MTSNQLPEPLPKYCILCVDDDHIGLGARAALLEGYSVIAVSCTLMALKYNVSQFHIASAYKVLNAVCFRLNSITIPVNRRMASIGQQIAVQAFGLLQSLQ